jgi:hypothetical protein
MLVDRFSRFRHGPTSRSKHESEALSYKARHDSEEQSKKEVEDLSMTLVTIFNDPDLCTSPFMLKHISPAFRVIRENTNEPCPMGNPTSREEL